MTLQRLEELEEEEEAREKAGFYAEDSSEEEDAEMAQVRDLASKIREKKKIMKVTSGWTWAWAEGVHDYSLLFNLNRCTAA